MINIFYCTVNVYGRSDTFLTKVIANSAAAAEHTVLDLGYVGKHNYGVMACTAYAVEECKTDCFIGALIHSEPISFEDLTIMIDEVNAEIAYDDQREEEIEKQRALIADIKRRIEALQEELEDEEDKLEEIMNK